MADPTNPHDRFFRSSMQNAVIAQQFFQHYLPKRLRNSLDFAAMELENSTYIDDSLQETISDLVFSCPYDDDITESNCDILEAKIILLVEHQSSPDRLMAFRVFHYLFNMLHSQLKQRSESQTKYKLPAVYALVFYHGKQTPYPYSMKLADCFDDPLKVMQSLFENPVHLVDVNQVEDDEIRQQQLLGIMTGALKHSRDRDMNRYLLQLKDGLNSMDLSDDLALKFLRTTLNYLLGVGNTADIFHFVKGAQQLTEPLRGEFMTIAEQLRAMGAAEAREETLEEGMEKGLEKGIEEGLEKGIEKGLETAANNLLKEGAEPRFIARITGLELASILQLKTKFEEEK